MEGNRLYESPSIVLTADQIRKLKRMNKVSAFDQSFVGYLLTAVFDSESILSVSIVGNAAQTNCAKLKFIEGNCIDKENKRMEEKTKEKCYLIVLLISSRCVH